MHGLTRAGIAVDRKTLADIAVKDAAALKALVARAAAQERGETAAD
jgi:ribosomal protein L20